MRSAAKRSVFGTRLQGVRHGRPRTTVPITKTEEPSKCVRAGNPEYPVSDTYADRRDGTVEDE